MINDKSLGDGEVVSSKALGKVFKLSSYRGNPILSPYRLNVNFDQLGRPRKELNVSVFNPGAEIFNQKIVLAPRFHRNYKIVRFYDTLLKIERLGMENYISEIRFFSSNNGVDFTLIDNLVIKGDGTEHKDFSYGIEDIRIIKTKSPKPLYFLIGCGKIRRPYFDYDADRIAIYSTFDFKAINYHGVIKEFDCRNAFCFPEYIQDKLYMFFRFRPNIHLAALEEGFEQLLNPHKYSYYWQKIFENRQKNLLLKIGESPHTNERIGPGPQLIKTKQGWLFFYFSVGKIIKEITTLYNLNYEITRGYSISCAILHLEHPYRILCKTKVPIYVPNNDYETLGSKKYPVDVPFVIFPTGAVRLDNKLLIYCGAGDKYCIVLSCDINNLLEYLFKYCYLPLKK
ncbi:MAG: hypothetical protein N2748_01040 [candidate division WOR-3 bacterium]|nr:hypothetical protein [candidate division WOR-3 bacterium]